MNELDLNTPIDIESCFDPLFFPPPEVEAELREQRIAREKMFDGPMIPAYYVTDIDGAQYFYYGNTRIKVTEHFNDNGKPIGALIEDVIRYSARQMDRMEKSA